MTTDPIASQTTPGSTPASREPIFADVDALCDDLVSRALQAHDRVAADVGMDGGPPLYREAMRRETRERMAQVASAVWLERELDVADARLAGTLTGVELVLGTLEQLAQFAGRGKVSLPALIRALRSGIDDRLVELAVEQVR